MMKKNIFKFILIFLLFGFKYQAHATSVDSLQHILKAAFENIIHPLDTLGDPLRLLGDRSMVDVYKEQNNSGIANKAEDDLKAAAVALVAAIPPAIAADFKVYDYTAYSLIGRFKEPEKWNNWVFNTMDSLVRNKYNTQYYLLIAKEINPSDGKVRFRVKLSLPTVASGNRPSGDRSSVVQLTKKTLNVIEVFALKTINNLAVSKFVDEADFISKIGINDIEKNLRLAFDGGFIGDGIYYNPAGYPVRLNDVYGTIPTDAIFSLKQTGNVVWSWEVISNDVVIETYRALVIDDKFRGYYKSSVKKPSLEDMYDDYPKTIPDGEDIYKLEVSVGTRVKKIPTNYKEKQNTPTKLQYFEIGYPVKKILISGNEGYGGDKTTGISEADIKDAIKKTKDAFEKNTEKHKLLYEQILRDQADETKNAFHRFLYALEHVDKRLLENKYYLDKNNISLQTDCKSSDGKWGEIELDKAIEDLDSKIIAVLTIQELLKTDDYKSTTTDLRIFEAMKKFTPCYVTSEIWALHYNTDTYLGMKPIYEMFSADERIGLIQYYSNMPRVMISYKLARIQLINLLVFTPEDQYTAFMSKLEDYHLSNIVDIAWQNKVDFDNNLLFTVAKKIQLMHEKIDPVNAKIIPSYVNFDFNPKEGDYKAITHNLQNRHSVEFKIGNQLLFETSISSYVKMKPLSTFTWQGETYEGGKEIIIPVCQLFLMIRDQTTARVLNVVGDVINAVSFVYGIGEAQAIYKLYKITGKVNKITVTFVGGQLLADGSRILCTVIGEKELLERYPDYYEKYKKVVFYLDMFNIARNLAGINAISDLKQAQRALQVERDALITKGATQAEKTTADAIDAKFQNSINALINGTEASIRTNLLNRGLSTDKIDDIIIRALYIDDELAKEGKSIMSILDQLAADNRFINHEDLFENINGVMKNVIINGKEVKSAQIALDKLKTQMNEFENGLYWIKERGQSVIISKKMTPGKQLDNEIDHILTSTIEGTKGSRPGIVECKAPHVHGNSAENNIIANLELIIKKFTEDSKLIQKFKDLYPARYGQINILNGALPNLKTPEDFVNFVKGKNVIGIGDKGKYLFSIDELRSLNELHILIGSNRIIIKPNHW